MTLLIAIGTLVNPVWCDVLTWTPGTGDHKSYAYRLVFATAAAVIPGLKNTTGKFGARSDAQCHDGRFFIHTVGGPGRACDL
ncbi:MAG: hypothetical protein Ct9H300mP14_15300 [Gammaproteobacteria bacterium]|nr:MAG: hypothetical protein Ct9H300mP14_15300 [Gammaproteobacteria bacterium]